jgi:hypothetical protein
MFASERDENARETERIRKDLWTPGKVYSSDLTVKEVSVEDLGTYHRSIFVGAEIRTYKGRIPRVELRPYCKNLEHIRRNGMQHYKMYKGRSSFTSDAVRYGSIMTAFCRIEMNSQTNRVLVEAARNVINELMIVGMHKAIVRKALNGMVDRNSTMRGAWKTVLNEIGRY